MSDFNVYSAAAKLENALKAFRISFAAVDPQWADVARREFEETYLAPMEPHVKNMRAAITRLVAVLGAAQRECGSDYGNSDE